MAIAYKSVGNPAEAGAAIDDIDPTYPATVDANDIAIAQLYGRGTAVPSSPSWDPDDQGVWTLLGGSPYTIDAGGITNVAFMWVYGRICDGSEDGAVANFGNTDAGTNVRGGRVYTFSGYSSGVITDVVPAASFAFLDHATDPQMPTVTTTLAGALAVALIAQLDDNTMGSATGESGGDWTEPTGEQLSNAFANDFMQGINVATPTADPGTISGGAIATANDPCGVVAFEIRPQGVAETFVPTAVVY